MKSNKRFPSNQCVIKPLSENIAGAFMLLYNSVENHNLGKFPALRLLSLFKVSIAGLLF